MSDMPVKVRRHLMLRRPSVLAIARLCQECLEHDHTWYEFKTSVKAVIEHENKVITMLEKELGRHMDRSI